jgi:2-desacetyl-2-hydroxyethyl bacteriochlorophyllide A dehydrogenase
VSVSAVTAAIMPAPFRPIELREFPEPDVQPGSILLKTIYSEVCGTDVHLWHGRLAGVPYPIIPGHVSVGTIAKMRGPVTLADGHQPREGDRLVFFDVHRTCGRCYACTVSGTPTKCASRRVYGITDAAADGLFGGWSEAIYLEPGVVAARLPERVHPEDYIGGGCGLITAVHAIDRAAIRLGDRVLVQGSGAVGLSIVALARLAGASSVIATGAPADRLDLARQMGADLTLDIAKTTPDERRALIEGMTGGRGPDVVIEASGSPRAIEEGLDIVRDGGRYVIAGHYTNAGPSTINAHEHINRKHLEIRGCWGSEAGHFMRALTILEQHASHVPWRAIGARVYPLNRLNEALADAEAMRLPKAVVDPRLKS